MQLKFQLFSQYIIMIVLAMKFLFVFLVISTQTFAVFSKENPQNISTGSCTLPWHISDGETGKCVCYNESEMDIVKCSDTHVEVLFGKCLTVDEYGTQVGDCLNNYPTVVYPSVDIDKDKRYVILSTSDNHSTINREMCARLNRHGSICSQCIDGYGPTALQAGFICGKCEWYGVLVYLLLEYGPLTLLFVILLVFPISITSPPMNCFVVFCQVVSTVVTYDSMVAKATISSGNFQAGLFYTFMTLSNIWSLDFTTYLVFLPPICISKKLSNVHVILLKYFSTAYPTVLVVVTYACVELHARDNKVITTLWRPFHRCIARTNRAWDPKKSIVDVFASFIFLSYSKLLLLSFLSLASTYKYSLSFDKNPSLDRKLVLRFDTTVDFFVREHIAIAMFSILICGLFIVFPVILLCCYPVKCFRKCLNSCSPNRQLTALNMFVEKFQGDYCDGLNGHRYDLRSFASMPMVILSGAYISAFLTDLYLSWLIYTFWLTIVTLVILVVRPYKKKHMNALSGLLMSLLIFYALLYNTFMNNLSGSVNPNLMQWLIVLSLLMLAVPQIAFISCLLYKPIKRCECFKKLKRFCVTSFSPGTRDLEDSNEIQEEYVEPDRLQNPDEYSPLLTHSRFLTERRSLTDQDTY